jgi:hypothetical protein
MIKVNDPAARDVEARLLNLQPFRDELGRIAQHYRFSSPEYRRLSEALAAIDDVALQLTGNRELLRRPNSAKRSPTSS